VNQNFDLRPGMLIKELGLRRPIYQRTAENGHFGHQHFPWEQVRDLYVAKNIQEQLRQHRQDPQPEAEALQQTA